MAMLVCQYTREMMGRGETIFVITVRAIPITSSCNSNSNSTSTSTSNSQNQASKAQNQRVQETFQMHRGLCCAGPCVSISTASSCAMRWVMMDDWSV